MGSSGVAVVAVAAARIFFPAAPAAAARLEFAIPTPGEVSHLALSPDGTMLAFVSPDDTSGAAPDRSAGWLSEVTILEGTDGANYPFWSPDDSYVGFFADNKLKKIEASGGTPQILAIAPTARGGSWSREA